jgi:hypothetical protein
VEEAFEPVRVKLEVAKDMMRTKGERRRSRRAAS